MVEFTFCIVIVIFLLFWVFEIVMLMHTYSVMAGAAKEGVRYAIVHGAANSSPSGPSSGSASNCSTNIANVRTVVSNYASGSFRDLSGLTTTVCYLDGNNKNGSRVQVTLSYPYAPYINMPWANPTISAASEGRIVF